MEVNYDMKRDWQKLVDSFEHYYFEMKRIDIQIIFERDKFSVVKYLVKI